MLVVEILTYAYLARKARAIPAPFGHLQKIILVVTHRLNRSDKTVVKIDMAGGAGADTATKGEKITQACVDNRLHQGVAGSEINLEFLPRAAY